MGREDDRGVWIRFHLSPLKDSEKKKLIEEFGEPAAVFAQTVSEVARAAETIRAAAERFLAERVDTDEVLRRAASCGAGTITWADEDYPELLRRCYDPPPVLFCRGDRSLLAGPVVSVVGSRKADRGASAWTTEIAATLAGAGFVVGSGLALGIDGAAHRGALRAGGGTIAVMGTGPDMIYPASHRRLGERIAREGLLVTEFAPGTPALPFHFPQRNRIIAGISEAVLVAQAAERSGAAITARLALEADREVMVLAAPPWDVRFAGNRRLAREGAAVVQDGEEVALRLGRTPAPREEAASDLIDGLSGIDREIARLLADCPADVDALSRKLTSSTQEVLASLMRLELGGVATEGPGKVYAINVTGSAP